MVILVMIAGMINWVWVGLPTHVNISGNSTIAPNEIAAQSVPSIINGITTSTNVIIAFSAAFSGILIGYVFKEGNRERDVIIVVLSIFPLPLLFEFFAYITLAGGQGLFEIALRLALVSFLYSLFALICIFIFTTYRMYERGKKSNLKKEEPPSTTETDETRTKNKKTENKPKAKGLEIFFGIFIAIAGGFLVSSIFESARSVFNREPLYIVSFYASMFMVSSILTFQFSKLALKGYFGKEEMKAFDRGAIACFFVGILQIVLYALFVRII